MIIQEQISDSDIYVNYSKYVYGDYAVETFG